MATVAENLQEIIDIKSDIKTAIENKGVDMSSTTFGDYANKIGEISGGSEVILPRRVKIAYSGYAGEKYADVSSYWEWPSNVKFYPTNMWNSAFRYVINVTNLPAISTIHPTDVNSGSDFSYMFANARFPIYKNREMWDSIDYSNVEYMNDMFANADLGDFTDELICSSKKLKKISYMFHGYGHNPVSFFNIIEFDDVSLIDDVTNVFSLDYVINNKIQSIKLKKLGKGFNGTSSTKHTLNLTKLQFANSEVITNMFIELSNVDVTDATIVLRLEDFSLLTDVDIAIATNKGWIVESA